MDAHGTRFHLLLGKDDWATCTGDNASWDEKRNELTLAPRLFRFQVPSQHSDPVVENRRGAAHDRYGNWYWIDATRTEVLVNSSGNGQTTHFWSSADGAAPARHGDFGGAAPGPASAAQTFGALSVTDHHYLVVGVLDPASLLIFDLHGGGPPRQVAWPKSVPFAPFDMAPAPGGGLWIFDRDNRNLWALDRLFNVLGDDAEPDPRDQVFQPADGSGTRSARPKTFPGGIPLPVLYPVALAALPDNTVLILETDPSQKFSRLYRFRFRQQLGAPVSIDVVLQLIDADRQADFRLLGYDMAYVAEQDQGGVTRYDVLYVTAANGDQSYGFQITLQGDQMSLEALPLYFPMRLFGGKGIVASGGRVYYDSRDQWVPLVAQRRPRYAPDAVLVTRVFDGKEPDCVWHRLMLDASITPGTSVIVSSRAANLKGQLDFTGWQPEPKFYLRGNDSEQPYVAQVMQEPRGADAGAWELLFQRAKGRYLQLQVELVGDGRGTPRLRALRAYYRRFSYLKNYLPAVYRENADSASFLDRFLANAEGFYTNIEDRIALAEVLLEVNNAPPETLGWLAGWFGVALDPAWDESTQRLFLRHAMDFFQYRGTIRGLGMALRLVLESCAGENIFDPAAKPRPGGIRLVERFRTRRTPGVVLGDPGVANGIPLTLQSTRWLPSQGAAELNRRYGGAYPISAPSNATQAAAQAATWKRFSLGTLGFLPRVSAPDGAFWTDFLTRRYQQIAKLNALWLTTYASFDEVAQPAALPTKVAPLRDWFQFQGVVLPMRDNAHRFTVLLPVPESEALDHAAQQRRMELAKRVIDLEKPAHTIYDLKFYWAFFRVGEARLGEDSVLDYGSRAPRLLPPMVLGTGFIASSYLAPGYPQRVGW